MSLLTDLIEYWTMDGNSFTDEVGEHASNTLNDNTSTLDSTDTAVIETAKAFDGGMSGEYFQAANTTFLQFGNEDFTFGFWVRLDTTSITMPIFGRRQNISGGLYEYQLYFSNTAGTFVWGVSSNGTNLTDIEANPTISANVFYYVICWHDASANTINIQVNNGTVASTSHSTGVFEGGATFRIGSIQTDSVLFDGIIDEFAVWNRVLTSDEREDLYNDGVGFPYPFLEPGTAADALNICIF